MKDYIGLANKCRDTAQVLPASFADATTIALLYAADKSIIELYENLVDCRNELCWKCGQYRNAHKGACDGCRWKEVG